MMKYYGKFYAVRAAVISLALVLLPSGMVSAEILQLKSGKTIEGVVVEETKTFVRIRTNENSYKIPLKQITERTPSEYKLNEEIVIPEKSDPAYLLCQVNRERLQLKVHQMVEAQRYPEIENMAREFRSANTVNKYGDFELRMLYEGIHDSYRDGDERLIKKYIKRFEEWGEEGPDSITQKLALADAYIALGWAYRGEGYAITVSEKEWEKFFSALTNANEMIMVAENLQVEDPRLYELKITAGNALGLPKLVLYEMAEKAMAVNPVYPYLHYAMSSALLPRWRGDIGEVEKYAEWAADQTREKAGDQMYALIANFVRKDVGNQDFIKFRFSWPRIKKGFEERLELYPYNFYILNSFTWFACYSNDKDTAQKLFKKIGDNWDKLAESAWGSRDEFVHWKKWAFEEEEETKPEPAGDKELRIAILNKDAEAVKKLLPRIKDINAFDVYGDTPFHLAVRKSSKEIVALLIEAGADLRLAGKDGYEAIQMAAYNHDIDLVRNLMQNNVPINTPQGFFFWTPLHIAAEKNFIELAKYLLTLDNVKLNLQNVQEMTPLYVAAQEGSLEVAQLLLNTAGVEFKAREQDGFTPLHAAASQGHLAIVKLFTEKGIDINIEEKGGETAADLAKKNGHMEIYDYLVRKGSKVHDDVCSPADRAEAERRHAKGNQFLKEGQTREAKEEYIKAVKYCDDMPVTYYNLYLITMNREESFTRALYFINKAIEHDPDEVEYYYELGQVYMKLRDPLKAKQYFRTFMERCTVDDPRMIRLIETFPDLRPADLPPSF